jgi:hypothetical protein
MDDLNLSKPVACTPTSPEQRAQTARLKADLAPQVLEREQLSDGVRLRFALSPEMRAQIERLVTFDKGCCDYLEHRIASSAEGLTLTVRSQGQGIEIAQNFLSLGTDKNSKPRGKLKVFALLGVFRAASLGRCRDRRCQHKPCSRGQGIGRLGANRHGRRGLFSLCSKKARSSYERKEQCRSVRLLRQSE